MSDLFAEKMAEAKDRADRAARNLDAQMLGFPDWEALNQACMRQRLKDVFGG